MGKGKSSRSEEAEKGEGRMGEGRKERRERGEVQSARGAHISKEDVNLSPEHVQGGVGFISDQLMINHGQTLVISLQGQKTLHSEEEGERGVRTNIFQTPSSSLLNKQVRRKPNTKATAVSYNVHQA